MLESNSDLSGKRGGKDSNRLPVAIAGVGVVIVACIAAVCLGIFTLMAHGKETPRLFPVCRFCSVPGDIRWGFIDSHGNVAIDFQFEAVDDFSEGLASVKVGGKWGYVDEHGQLVINPQFKQAAGFSEGLGQVELGEEWAYIDRKGAYAINPQFEDCYPFSKGLAAVRSGGKWGFIDKSGKYLINPQFDLAFSFESGGDLALVELDKKWGYIDKKGTYVINPQFEDANSFSDDLATVKVGESWGYINKDGKYEINPQFEEASPFSEQLARVKLGNRYGYINKRGALVVQPQFEDATDFSEGLAAVKVGGKWGYIDASGKMIIDPGSLDKPGPFRRGIAATAIYESSGSNLYIDKKGEWIYPSASTFQTKFAQLSPLLEADLPKTGPSGQPLKGYWSQCVNGISSLPICYNVNQGDATQYAQAIYQDSAIAKKAAELQFDLLIFNNADMESLFVMKSNGREWAPVAGYKVPHTSGGDTNLVSDRVEGANSSSAPVYSDLRIDVQSLTKKPYYDGCILRARIHNKSSYMLSTVIIKVNGYDSSGTLTEDTAFVFNDVPAFGDAEEDMSGILKTMPATVKIVNVLYP